MTFVDDLARVSLIWKPTTATWAGEQAVNTFWLQHVHDEGNTFVWEDAVQFTADRLVTKLASGWGSIQSFHSSHAGIVGVKVAQISNDGTAVSEGLASITDGSLNGTGGGSMLPPEVACALSLYGFVPGSFTAHPGRKRGRMYLPYLNSALLDTDGTIKHDLRDAIRDGWASIFSDISGMGMSDNTINPDDKAFLVVASKIGTGLATRVSHLVVDDHFDSQRRRQRQTLPSKSAPADVTA